MADFRSPYQPGTYFGPFLLVRKIAHGGMGYVFEATEVALGRRVALKLIDKELRQEADFIKRFQREAQTLGRVVHPNVVSVHSLGEHEGIHYIAMDYVEGQNLREFLASGQFFLGDLLEIFRKIAFGLSAIHACGIVHRDIKLSNILVDKHREARIADFGLAKPLGDSSGDITATGQLIGTLQYMAPELLANEPFTERSDIFALGLLFFEALVGYNPFRAETSVETADRIRNVELVFPAEVQDLVPPELRALVHGMTAKKVFARMQNMDEVRAQLEAAIRQMPAAAQKWPPNFSVANMQEAIDYLLDRGCSSPVEVSLVLAKACEASYGKPVLKVDPALIERGLNAVRSKATPLAGDLSEIEVPSLEIPKEKVAPKPKRATSPREELVEIDEKALQTERRKDEIALAKSTAQRVVAKPVELEKTAPQRPHRQESEMEIPRRIPTQSPVKWGTLFAPRRLFLLALSTVTAYGWFVAGKGDAIVAGPPECSQSAEGFEGALPYKDIAFPAGFSPFRELGIVCDSQWLCWARSRPWVSFQAQRDRPFPKNPWGETYLGNGLLVFYDSEKNTLRVRSSSPSQQVRLNIGLEECVFSLRKERMPLLRYHLAMLVGSQLEEVLGGSEATPSGQGNAAPSGKSAVMPPVPEKKDATWNQRGWDRFMNYINSGK